MREIINVPRIEPSADAQDNFTLSIINGSAASTYLGELRRASQDAFNSEKRDLAATMQERLRGAFMGAWCMAGGTVGRGLPMARLYIAGRFSFDL